MALDDDTFSDSDRSSGDTYVYMGSSYCGRGHHHSHVNGWAALIVLVVLLVIVVIVASSSDKTHNSVRREQQTDAMIKAWARSMNVTVAGYSCKHEPSRALCDIRLENGNTKYLQCGKGGCSER